MTPNTILRAALAAVTIAGTLTLGAGLTVADAGGFSQQTYFRIWSITPRCRDHPDYPVVGRVAGYLSGSNRSRLSWVGCFPNQAECEAWRYIARGEVTPPVQQNSCRPRR